MYTYFSDFKLPKEYSKKKKIQISVAEVSPAKVSAGDTKKWEWKLDTDLTRAFLTIEGAVKDAVLRACHDKKFKNSDDILASQVCILTLEFPINVFNDFPVATNVNGEPIDAEFDPETLSFNVTLQGRFAESSHLDILAIDAFKVDVEHDKVTSVTVRPIINSAAPMLNGESTAITL